jgi:hypothetical protein
MSVDWQGTPRRLNHDCHYDLEEPQERNRVACRIHQGPPRWRACRIASHVPIAGELRQRRDPGPRRGRSPRKSMMQKWRRALANTRRRLPPSHPPDSRHPWFGGDVLLVPPRRCLKVAVAFRWCSVWFLSETLKTPERPWMSHWREQPPITAGRLECGADNSLGGPFAVGPVSTGHRHVRDFCLLSCKATPLTGAPC